MKNIEYEYQSPRQIDENLWEVRGEWSNKLGRRMTIIRLRDQRLLIHSSIRLHQKNLDWLNSLGKPAFILVPNSFHFSDASWMCEKYPKAQLFTPQSKFEFFEKLGLHPHDINSEFPSEISGEVKCIPMQGSRMQEAAFIHLLSKTLILCDLAFNMGDVFSGFAGLFMKWNKVGGQFGPSRLTKLFFASDRQKLLHSYQILLHEDFDRVIVNHGEILESNGKEKLREGIERIW